MSLASALRRRLKAHPRCRGFELDLAGAADLDALDRLNAVAVAETGEEVYGRQDRAFFESVIGAGGEIVVLRRGGVAEGYSIALPAAALISLFADEPCTGVLHGTALAASARGMGWQRALTGLRVEALIEVGFTTLKAFVSPRNHRSLRNLLAEGFEVVTHDWSHYRRHRFVVEARPGAPGPVAKADATLLALPPGAPLDPHIAGLAQGWRGVVYEGGERPGILYRR